MPPRLAALREGGDDFAAVFLAGAFLEGLFFAVETFFVEELAEDFLGADFFDADFFDDDFFEADFDPDFFAPPARVLLLVFDLAAILTLRGVRTDGDVSAGRNKLHALTATARITVCRATHLQFVQLVHIRRQ
ncbi:MAG TPA: hypothetical protein VF701_04605 [Thermoanaerobaculia bacterium]